MEQLTILDLILVKTYLLGVLIALVLQLYSIYKLEINKRSYKRYITILERKIKGSE